MTDCPNAEIRDLLPDLLHDRLASAERARVEAHLASCADCRAELALLRSVRAAMSATPSIDPARIARMLPKPAAPAPRSMHAVPAWRRWRVAAVVATLVTGGATVGVLQQVGIFSGPDSAATRLVTRPVDSGGGMTGGRSDFSLTFGASLADLTDAQLQGLLDGLDAIETLPALEPEATVPAAAALEESL